VLRRVALIALILSTVAASACSDDDSGESTATRPTVSSPSTDDSLRLHEVQVLGSHNSYHGRPDPSVLAALAEINRAVSAGLDYAHAPLPEQFDLGVRQIELDVWSDPEGGKFANPGLPAQVGAPLPDATVMAEPGFKVLHEAGIDTNSTCLTFVLCLEQVRDWSREHPGHVAMNVQVEMKDDDVDAATFAALEDEIRSVFDADELLTPDDVRGDAPTLGDAVRERGWPTLGETRGRVFFTLDNTGLRDGYLEGHPSLRGRLLFTPSEPGADDAAFAKLNDPIGDAQLIRAALAANMIVRTRADADTVQARTNDHTMRDAALTSGAQLVSTDYEQADPTLAPPGDEYVVRIPDGTPARCSPVTASSACTPAAVEDPARLAGG
jgi:hypothetical protein